MQHALMLILISSAIGQSKVELANDGPKAFAHLRTLVGEWHGTFQWSGARNDAGKMNATYYLTGNGSAVVENLTVDGTPMMTSVYHLSGGELRMTHYCAAQNQPRLSARSFDFGSGTIDFEFIDATNLSSPDAPHVHGLVLRNSDDEHLELQFTFKVGTKQSLERITLARVGATKP